MTLRASVRSARLRLRPHREDDLGWLQEMYTQPEVVRHLLDEPWDEATARAKGFLMVSASPLTRSSYHAGEDFAKLKAARAALTR